MAQRYVPQEYMFSFLVFIVSFGAFANLLKE